MNKPFVKFVTDFGPLAIFLYIYYSSGKDIKVALVRPGLGTISDLLACKSFIVPIYEKNNAEMAKNADVLSKIGHCNCGVDQMVFFIESALKNKFDTKFLTQRSFSGCEESLKLIEQMA